MHSHLFNQTLKLDYYYFFLADGRLQIELRNYNPNGKFMTNHVLKKISVPYQIIHVIEYTA